MWSCAVLPVSPSFNQPGVRRSFGRGRWEFRGHARKRYVRHPTVGPDTGSGQTNADFRAHVICAVQCTPRSCAAAVSGVAMVGTASASRRRALLVTDCAAVGSVVSAIVGGVYWRTLQAGIPGGDRYATLCPALACAMFRTPSWRGCASVVSWLRRHACLEWHTHQGTRCSSCGLALYDAGTRSTRGWFCAHYAALWLVHPR